MRNAAFLPISVTPAHAGIQSTGDAAPDDRQRGGGSTRDGLAVTATDTETRSVLRMDFRLRGNDDGENGVLNLLLLP